MIEAEAKVKADTLMQAATDKAAEDVQKAHEVAEHHIRNAQMQAEQARREALAVANETYRQAGLEAQAERDAGEEQRRAQAYWEQLAAAEEAGAGLPPVAPSSAVETLTDGQLDASGAAS